MLSLERLSGLFAISSHFSLVSAQSLNLQQLVPPRPTLHPALHIQVSKANANMLSVEKLSTQLQRQVFSTTINGHFAVPEPYVIFWDFKSSTFNGETTNKCTSKGHEGESPSSKHKISFNTS